MLALDPAASGSYSRMGPDLFLFLRNARQRLLTFEQLQKTGGRSIFWATLPLKKMWKSHVLGAFS